MDGIALTLRIPEGLHKRLVDIAAADHRSLNNLIRKMLEEQIGGATPLPLPPIAASVANTPTLMDRAENAFGGLPEALKGRREAHKAQASPDRCPHCGGMLGEYRKSKRVCQVCGEEVRVS